MITLDSAEGYARRQVGCVYRLEHGNVSRFERLPLPVFRGDLIARSTGPQIDITGREILAECQENMRPGHTCYVAAKKHDARRVKRNRSIGLAASPDHKLRISAGHVERLQIEIDHTVRQ